MITEAQVAPPEPPKRMTVAFSRSRELHPNDVMRDGDVRYTDIVAWHLDSATGYYFLTHADGWILGVPIEGRHVLLTPQD